MNMCADCGSVLDRGFVVVMDFKLLCAQQLAILDSEDNVRFLFFQILTICHKSVFLSFLVSFTFQSWLRGRWGAAG